MGAIFNDRLDEAMAESMKIIPTPRALREFKETMVQIGGHLDSLEIVGILKPGIADDLIRVASKVNSLAIDFVAPEKPVIVPQGVPTPEFIPPVPPAAVPAAVSDASVATESPAADPVVTPSV